MSCNKKLLSSLMRYSILCAMLATLAACSSPPPIQTAQAVDLERFMGDWYVIANIPTWIERDAHNAMESYRLAEDGTVATTFTFQKGGFEGDLKVERHMGNAVHLADPG